MKRMNEILKWLLVCIAVVAGFLLFFAGNFFLIPEIQEIRFASAIKSEVNAADTLAGKDEMLKMKKQVDLLNVKIDKLTPGGAFLIINTTDNSFRLFKNSELIRRGKCSTGSLIQLEVDSTKSYTFETPKGALTVKSKITDPIWRKPDWAFIEEGLPVPSPNHASRYERGVLGDYALALGDGYLIHGTLYQRLLGLPVTHGCIRLADEDLEVVYKNLQVGSKVFIY